MTTLEDIRKSSKETISAATAGSILGCDPQLIRVQARQDRTQLGFPVILMRRRVLIPRRPFLAYIEGGATTPLI